MSASRRDPWEAFKTSPNPLAKIRDIKAALPEGPGINQLYEEARVKGTVLGIPVLTVGERLYVPRQKVVDRIEGQN